MKRSEDKNPGDPRLEVWKKGEKLAEKFLKRKGFRLVERNLRGKMGEIDLLMQDGDDLVIVEVRAISHKGEYDLEEKVPYGKRKQLVRLAKTLVSELPDPLPPVRIDVCIVVLQPGKGKKPEIIHYEDAFHANQF